jgi:hypothetical protein
MDAFVLKRRKRYEMLWSYTCLLKTEVMEFGLKRDGAN